MTTDHHVLLVGGMRVMHDALRQFPGVRTTLMTRAHQVQGRDARDNVRIIAPASNDAAEWTDLAQVVHRHDPITAVGAYHEMDQDKAAQIACALGLPFHAPAVIERVRNKAAARERLQALHVDPTPSAVVTTAAAVQAFAETHGYPLIVKPQDGWGSTNIAVLRHPRDLSALHDPSSPLVVEPYLEGTEYSVEALSERGRHRVVAITQKHKHPVTFVETGHVVPAPLSDIDSAHLQAFTTRVLTALEIQDGPTHTEVMLTARGPRFIETHTRLPGDNIPDLILHALGLDLFRATARQTLGHRVLDDLTPDRPAAERPTHAAIWYGHSDATGVVEQVAGVDAARAAPGVQAVMLLKKPGEALRPVRTSFDRPMCVIATGQSPAEAAMRARDALRHLRFSVTALTHVPDPTAALTEAPPAAPV